MTGEEINGLTVAVLNPMVSTAGRNSIMVLTRFRPISIGLGVLLLVPAILIPAYSAFAVWREMSPSEGLGPLWMALLTCIPLIPAWCGAFVLFYRPNLTGFSTGLGVVLLYGTVLSGFLIPGDRFIHIKYLLLGIIGVSLHAAMMRKVKHIEGITTATFWGGVGEGHCAGVAFACYPTVKEASKVLDWPGFVPLLLAYALYCILSAALRRFRP